ncbi:MAG: BREX-3 system phosphatase PglZ [Psychrobacillus psychrodurans]
MNWSEKIASYFTGNGFIYIVADEHNILGQSNIEDMLKQQDRVLHFYEDPLVFRHLYDSSFRHVDRTDRQTLLIIIRNGLFNQIPYDVYEQAIHLTLSFNTLYPNLEPSVLKQCTNLMYGAIYAHQNVLIQPLNERETADFLLNDVCGIHVANIANDTALIKSGLMYYENFDEGLPPILLKRLEQLLSSPTKYVSLDCSSIFKSKEEFSRLLNQKWQQYISELIKSADEQIAEKQISYGSNDFRDPFLQRYIEQYIEPVQVANNRRFEYWMLPGLFIREEESRIVKSIFMEDYTTFERNDWLQFANDLGQLQHQQLLNGHHEESFQENVSMANGAFNQWMKENFQQLRSLPVVPKPKMVHQIPQYLAREADKKIALIVLDGMSFTQWHLIKEHLHSKTWKFEEAAVFAWVPSVTSVSRQALFSGLEPQSFADTIDTTRKEKALWTKFWEQQGFSKKNVAYEKSLGFNSYNREDLAYQFSPSIRIYGAVIDVIDQFMHGATQGLQTVQSELNTWLNSRYLDMFLEDLINAGFEVYLTADHGNVECIGTGRIAQGVTVDSKGERVRIYSSENIRNHTASEHANTIAWEDASLPSDYHVLLAQKKGAFVPKNDKIVTHGGIHLEEMIVPFVKVSK